jgi:3-oxoacyl-[acyl-carrier protein] reductase
MSKVALVTGASRGIGCGIAVALAERGWSIAINYLRNAQAAAQALQLVQHAGGSGVVVQADVAASADRARLVNETIGKLGEINLLVNNAGMGPRQRVDMLEANEVSFDEVMATNLKGPFFLTQLVARRMIDALPTKPNPQIVNIGSISAYASSTNRAEYCLSKAGVGMMTVLFADRLAEFGINVYEIRPGIIQTDLTSKVKDKYEQMIASGVTPIHRWGQPDDIGRAVVAIAERLLPFSTGEIINVDGGFHLRRL